MRSLFCLCLSAHFLDASSLVIGGGPPTTRRRTIRDQMLLPMLTAIGGAGATRTAAGAPVRKAIAIEGASATTLTAPKPPPPSVISSGVLWRTVSGQALPATPASLFDIMKREVLGEISSGGNAASSSGIVCISERHDDFEHHKVQLKVLMTIRKVLAERGQDASERLSIGMEMFQRRHQRHLDRYVADQSGAYSVDDLRRDTEWDRTWGYDLLHYLPLLQFARRRGVRILGLHPSDDEVERVERHGLAGCGLTGVCTTDREHAQEFREVSMRQFTSSGVDYGCREAMDAAIARRYEVQCFREEYMAEAAAVHVASRPDGWIALLAGERHILKRNGLPFRVLRRSTNVRKGLSSAAAAASSSSPGAGGTSTPSNRGVFTIVPRTISFPMAAKDAPGMAVADYVWYVQRDPEAVFKEDEVNLAPVRIGQTSA